MLAGNDFMVRFGEVNRNGNGSVFIRYVLYIIMIMMMSSSRFQSQRQGISRVVVECFCVLLIKELELYNYHNIINAKLYLSVNLSSLKH